MFYCKDCDKLFEQDSTCLYHHSVIKNDIEYPIEIQRSIRNCIEFDSSIKKYSDNDLVFLLRFTNKLDDLIDYRYLEKNSNNTIGYCFICNRKFNSFINHRKHKYILFFEQPLYELRTVEEDIEKYNYKQSIVREELKEEYEYLSQIDYNKIRKSSNNLKNEIIEEIIKYLRTARNRNLRESLIQILPRFANIDNEAEKCIKHINKDKQKIKQKLDNPMELSNHLFIQRTQPSGKKIYNKLVKYSMIKYIGSNKHYFITAYKNDIDNYICYCSLGDIHRFTIPDVEHIKMTRFTENYIDIVFKDFNITIKRLYPNHTIETINSYDYDMEIITTFTFKDYFYIIGDETILKLYFDEHRIERIPNIPRLLKFKLFQIHNNNEIELIGRNINNEIWYMKDNQFYKINIGYDDGNIYTYISPKYNKDPNFGVFISPYYIWFKNRSSIIARGYFGIVTYAGNNYISYDMIGEHSMKEINISID